MLNPETKYRLGDPVDYTSMYGYAKRRFPVYAMNDDGESSVGSIKEEKIINENGDVEDVMFYERNGWKKSGQQRFYTSCEALVIACGGKFSERKVVAVEAPKKARITKAAVKKARAKTPVAKKVLTSRQKAAAVAAKKKKRPAKK